MTSSDGNVAAEMQKHEALTYSTTCLVENVRPMLEGTAFRLLYRETPPVTYDDIDGEVKLIVKSKALVNLGMYLQNDSRLTLQARYDDQLGIVFDAKGEVFCKLPSTSISAWQTRFTETWPGEDAAQRLEDNINEMLSDPPDQKSIAIARLRAAIIAVGILYGVTAGWVKTGQHENPDPQPATLSAPQDPSP